MRYGFFGDMHGDYQALERALKALEDTDQIMFLGDAVGGPRDRECLELLRERAFPAVCGNHDLDPIDTGYLPRELQAYLKALPLCQQREGFKALHSFYCQSGSYVRFFYVYDVEEGELLFQEFPDRLFFIGHTHVPALHERGGRRQLWEESTVVQLDPRQRYICNVGMTRQGVVVYDSELETLEIRLFERPFDRVASARYRSTGDCASP
jgi:predicted phosphodiesterase